jgi:hypothetical protein
MLNTDLPQQVLTQFAEKLAAFKPSFRIKKRRTARDRLKARLYYRKNKAKIKLWRRRYTQKMKMQQQARKFLKRERPSWFSKKKKPSSKPKSFKTFLKNITKGQTSHAYKPKSTVKNPFKIHIPKKR